MKPRSSLVENSFRARTAHLCYQLAAHRPVPGATPAFAQKIAEFRLKNDEFALPSKSLIS